MTKTQQELEMKEIKQTASIILDKLYGLVAIKVLNIGLRQNIFATINSLEAPISATELAEILDLDEVYLNHCMETAYAFDYLEMNQFSDQTSYCMAKHLDKLLLDPQFPAYIGGFPELFDMDEMFGLFEQNIQTGDRVWWEDASSDWIRQVGKTAISMYSRMIPTEFSKIPEDKLKQGVNILELASGTGRG